MAKKRYKFNPHTLTYELIVAPFRIRFYRILRRVLVAFILASILNLVVSLFFYTPKMYQIQEDKNELLLKYSMLEDKVDAATARVEELRHRDNYVYRPLFAADSLSLYGIYTPYADTKYQHMEEDLYAPMMINTWKKLDALTRLVYLESKSLDQLQVMAKDKEKMAEAIPAIWPINRKNLKGNIGAYGMRFHPILHRVIMHKGIDLGGRTGDPIYATGDGVIAFDNRGTTGYGIQVVIEHGFGYSTRYAHLNKKLVEPGQQVKRGELIAELGNTGRSSGSHLHYEVIYRDRTVDPLNYFSREMTDEEFTAIIESAEATTFEAL